MGIRVHKVIGYGIDGLQHDNGKMTDPRVNWRRLEAKLEKAWEVDAAKFLKWCVTKRKAIQTMEVVEARLNRAEWDCLPYLLEMDLKGAIKDKQHWLLGDHFVEDSEYGIPEVMLFTPVGVKWKRYDDTIDWVEETECHGQQNRIVKFAKSGKSGIYPYDGFMVRFKDPEPRIMDDFGDILKKWVECFPGESRQDDKGFVFLSSRLYDILVERKCSADHKLREHLVNDWRPMLPPELMPVLLWFKDCFTDLKSFMDSLKPMLYVYWS